MEAVTAALLVVLAFIAVDFLRTMARKRRSLSSNEVVCGGDGSPLRTPPSAASCGWLLGHLPFLVRRARRDGTAMDALHDLCRQSSDPIVALYLGPPSLVRPIYLVVGEKAGQRLAAKAAPAQRVTATLAYVISPRTFVTGLKGADLKRHRKAMAAGLLRSKKLEVLAALAGKHCSATLRGLADDGDDGPVVLTEPGALVGHVAQTTMVEMLLGADLTDERHAAAGRTFLSSLQTMVEYLSHNVRSAFSPPTNLLLHPVKYARMRRAVTHMRRDWVQPAIDRRRADLADGKECRDDALATLLLVDGLRVDEQLNDEEVADEILSLLFASETATSVLQWVLFELAQHPDIQRKCREEIESVLGTCGDEHSKSPSDQSPSPTRTQLLKMPYWQAFLKETMRLDPISASHIRDITTDMNIEGFLLKQGCTAAFTYHLAQVSEKNFSSASEFSVERWLSDPVTGGAKHGRDTLSYAPFGYGPHRCFGQAVGMTIVGVVGCIILQRYRVELVSDAAAAKRFVRLLTYQPKELVIRLVPHGR